MPQVTLQYYSQNAWPDVCGTESINPAVWDASGCAIDLSNTKSFYYRDQSSVIPLGSRIDQVDWEFSCYTATPASGVPGRVLVSVGGGGVSDSIGYFDITKTNTSYPQTDTSGGTWSGGDVTMYFSVVNKESFYQSVHHITNGSITITYTPPTTSLFFGSNP